MTDRYQSRPFPLDDDDSRASSRYPQKPENDPLAELARLIGQTDPFGQAAPRPEPAPPVAPQTRSTDFRASRPVPPQAEDESSPPPMPSWMQHRQTARAPEPQRTQEPTFAPEPDFSRPPSFINAAPPRRAEAPSFERAPAIQPPIDPNPLQMRPLEQPAMDLRSLDPRFDPAPPEQRQLDLPPPDRVHYEPPFEPLPATSLEPDRYDEALYGQLPADPAPVGGYQESPYGYEDGYDDQADQRALKPRRNTMLTVVGILALAVVGTGGALAYRTFAGTTRTGEPPVIKADTSPTKVPGPSNDNAGKPIQDRLASSNGVEALVSREEQPAADPSRMPGSGPRVVLPQLNQNPNPPPVASVAPGGKPTCRRRRTTARWRATSRARSRPTASARIRPMRRLSQPVRPVPRRPPPGRPDAASPMPTRLPATRRCRCRRIRPRPRLRGRSASPRRRRLSPPPPPAATSSRCRRSATRPMPRRRTAACRASSRLCLDRSRR